ncbi:PLP-dependent aminotransferase family protein [Kitasatospora sp. NPDC050543]|uniref:MocR-like pyridoxine biosynthesis transcription factor PdxR n=1 Tax=Kitasatospora sp. NPDC050543 TaxID=3364054 RepID=UPI0037B5648B
MARQLALTLDRSLRRPLSAQVREAIRAAVEDGTLKPGTRLPSSRQLAADLAVSRSVLVEAYEQLTAEGYLLTRRGSGSVVAEGRGPALRAPVRSMLAPVDGPAAAGVCDLRTGNGVVRSFPRQEWLRSAAAVVRQSSTDAFGYGPPAGLPELREVLAGYLGRVRGVRTTAENVMVTAGFAQGLAMLCQVLRARGITRIAVEDPGHPGEREFIARAGLEVVAVPVDGQGLRVEELARSEVRAVLATPGNHFPTGVPLAPERRALLADWARQVDGYVIEDDFDGAFLPAGRARPALQALAPDRVVHAGTVSKVLAPSLRLGWLAGPPVLMAELEAFRAGLDIGCPGLDQLTLAHFIDTGALDRHLRRLRRDLSNRRGQLHGALGPVPGISLSGLDGGLQAYVRLPAGADENALVTAAARGSVLLRGASHYAMTPGPPGLVLNYAGPPPSALTQALAVLADLCRRL